MEHRRLNNLNKPTQLSWLNDMLEYLFDMVQGGIGVKEISGGTINTVKIRSPKLATGVNPGNCVVYDATAGEWIKYQRGIGVVDTDNNIVIIGECELNNLQPGYNAYADENGDVTQESITDYPIGYAMSESVLLVMASGEWGIPKVYEGVMREFRVMPGPDGKIRVKFQFPDGADGAMLRMGTEPYDGSGLEWGQLVAEFTSDTDYHGFNKYYVVPNLSNGVKYYFYIFPRKATLYNDIENDKHKATCKAGTLIHEYLFGSQNGSTLVDTAGSKNGTNYNVAIVSGPCDVEDEAGSYNGSSSKTTLPSNWSDFLANDCAFEFAIEPTGDYGTVISIMYGSYSAIGINSNGLGLSMNNNSGRVEAPITSDIYTHVIMNRDTAQGLELFFNNVSKATDPYTGTDGSLTYGNYLGMFRVGLESWWQGKLAFLRIYNDTLDSDERASLENGGDWW